MDCSTPGLPVHYQRLEPAQTHVHWVSDAIQHVILEPKKMKSATVSTVSPSICHEVIGPDAMILVFWMLSFKPTFSLSFFTFIQRLFSSSSLSAIRVVSSVYLRLLIFLPASWFQLVLLPAWHFNYCSLFQSCESVQICISPHPLSCSHCSRDSSLVGERLFCSGQQAHSYSIL